mmetsp:Transcript_14789/g.28012  ORF Transcript_14789/g.28012 Transcript_14789/m.28012 type:complete len:243 (-) Transcript_14789:1199-1927(-)
MAIHNQTTNQAVSFTYSKKLPHSTFHFLGRFHCLSRLFHCPISWRIVRLRHVLIAAVLHLLPPCKGSITVHLGSSTALCGRRTVVALVSWIGPHAAIRKTIAVGLSWIVHGPCITSSRLHRGTTSRLIHGPSTVHQGFAAPRFRATVRIRRHIVLPTHQGTGGCRRIVRRARSGIVVIVLALAHAFLGGLFRALLPSFFTLFRRVGSKKPLVFVLRNWLSFCSGRGKCRRLGGRQRIGINQC